MRGSLNGGFCKAYLDLTYVPVRDFQGVLFLAVIIQTFWPHTLDEWPGASPTGRVDLQAGSSVELTDVESVCSAILHASPAPCAGFHPRVTQYASMIQFLEPLTWSLWVLLLTE